MSRITILFAAALLLAGRAALAQPACTGGTAADYAADGFACRIGPWRLDSFFLNAGAARFLTGRGIGSVGALPIDCGFPIARQAGAVGGVALDDEVLCDPTPTDLVSVSVASDAFLERGAVDAITFDGPATATGTAERVTFIVAPNESTVTPEPASAVLLGAGLAGLGALGLRRHRGGTP
jgi:hypothetical protein